MSCALLVVDVQEALFGPQPRPGDADATVARINALAARARGSFGPRIVAIPADQVAFDL